MDAVKAAQREMWQLGEDTLAEHLWEVGRRIVERLAIGPGDTVLDVACGTGNAAIQAAQAGAAVIAVDFAGELLEAANDRARALGVAVDWRLGDAEALPVADASYDAVVSTFGAMFAADQRTTAGELARVLRPGGRLGLCNWTPDGTMGELLRVLERHWPLPSGAEASTRWGDERAVGALFDGTGLELSFAHDAVPFRWPSVEHAVATFATAFSPVVAARIALEPTGEWPALRDELARLFARVGTASSGGLALSSDYLVVIGHSHQPHGG